MPMNTTNDIRGKLKDLILRVLRSEVKPEELEGVNLIHKLGISSVDSLEILINIEIEFGIQVDDQDLTQELVSSLDTLESYIRTRLPAQSNVS